MLAIIIAASAYVYRGFFYYDPLIFDGKYSGYLKLSLYALYIIIPIATALAIVGWLHFRRRAVIAAHVSLAVFGVAIALVITYLIASIFYYSRSLAHPAASYHPYLQLAPSPIILRKNESSMKPYRIFCLGGSTTEWPDSGGRDWPSRVEVALRSARPGRPVEIYNQGREWYTSLHSLINYTTNLRAWRPDLIVVMHAVNDLFQNADFSYLCGEPFRADYGHCLGPVARVMRRKSFFENVADKLSSAWYFPGRETVTATKFPGLDPFRRNLRTLIELARIDGTRVVLMTEPYLYKEHMTAEEKAHLYMPGIAIGPTRQWDQATPRFGMEQYDDAIRELARTEGTPLIDLEQVVPKTLEYFRDDVHYTDRAYPLVAGYISSVLEGSGVLDNEKGEL